MSCLVIFDLDGVLVDTEKLYMDMNLAWFKSLGFEMPQTIYLQFIGASGRLFWQYIVDVYKLSLPVEQYILAEKYRLTVGNDHIVSSKEAGLSLKVLPSSHRLSYAKAKVDVFKHTNGRVSVLYKGEKLNFKHYSH